MRTEGQIRRKLKQVIFRHLQKELRVNLRKRPHNCVHNTPTEGLRLCMLDAEAVWPSVCDAEHGGVERAKHCEFFQPKVTKDDIKQEMERILAQPREEVAKKFPAIGALMWVLDETPYTGELPEAEPADEPEEVPEDEKGTSWNPFNRWAKK